MSPGLREDTEVRTYAEGSVREKRYREDVTILPARTNQQGKL